MQTVEFLNTQKVNLEIKGAKGVYFIEVTTKGNKKANLMILKE